jgi:negative regulator of sigma E activity
MPSIKSLAWMAAVSAAVVIGLQKYADKQG